MSRHPARPIGPAVRSSARVQKPVAVSSLSHQGLFPASQTRKFSAASKLFSVRVSTRSIILAQGSTRFGVGPQGAHGVRIGSSAV